MSALEHSGLGLPIVIDVSVPVPCLRQQKLLEAPADSVFVGSKKDLDRLANLCSNLLEATPQNAQNLIKVLQIHDCICQLRSEEQVVGDVQEKAANVAIKVLNAISEVFGKAPKSMQEQIFPTYLSSVQGRLPERYRELTSILEGAEVLRGLFPDQAIQLIHLLEEAADKIRKREPYPEHAPFLGEEKEEISSCCETAVRLLQEAGKQINLADPEWELRLRTVLIATKKLPMVFEDEVLDALARSQNIKCLPEITAFETLELLESCRLVSPDYIKYHKFLGSDYAAKLVQQLEESIRNGKTDQQIACVERLAQLHYKRDLWSITLPAFDTAVVQTFCSSPCSKELAVKHADKFWDVEIYKTLSVLAPDVAQEYAHRLVERMKDLMPSDDIVSQLHWLDRIDRHLSGLKQIAYEFVDQQFRAIVNGIVQGQIELANIQEKSQAQYVLRQIFSIYKNNMESLLESLGDHVKEFFEICSSMRPPPKEFFEIYGAMQSRQIAEAFKAQDFNSRADLDSSLDRSLDGIRRCLQLPPQFRMVNLDENQLRSGFETIGKAVFAQPVDATMFMPFMKFGQLCYWLNQLFYLKIPSQKLPDDTFQSMEKMITDSAEKYRANQGEVLPSLIGKGFRDEHPVVLIDALPIDDDQRERLIWSIKKNPT